MKEAVKAYSISLFDYEIPEKNQDRFYLPSLAPDYNQASQNISASNTLNALMKKALTFKASGPPKSELAKVLINLNNLYNSEKLTKPQKDSLKTLALRSDKVLLAASMVYDNDKDESEFLDTLQKISHLAFL